MQTETAFALTLIAVYVLVRYLVGLGVENRWAALAITFFGLSTLAVLLLGVAFGGQAVGAMFVAAVIDALWRRKPRVA